MPKVDVALDPLTGDLPAVSRVVSGSDLLVQRLGIRLRTHLGEWLLDQGVGLDFIGTRAQKPADPVIWGVAVRAELEATPGVARIAEFESTFDRVSRTLRVVATLFGASEEAIGLEAGVTLGPTGNRAPWVLFHRHIGLGLV